MPKTTVFECLMYRTLPMHVCCESVDDDILNVALANGVNMTLAKLGRI